MSLLDKPAQIISAAREETEARGETFYQGPSRINLAATDIYWQMRAKLSTIRQPSPLRNYYGSRGGMKAV